MQNSREQYYRGWLLKKWLRRYTEYLGLWVSDRHETLHVCWPTWFKTPSTRKIKLLVFSRIYPWRSWRNIFRGFPKVFHCGESLFVYSSCQPAKPINLTVPCQMCSQGYILQDNARFPWITPKITSIFGLKLRSARKPDHGGVPSRNAFLINLWYIMLEDWF